jgi:hypothetical protein
MIQNNTERNEGHDGLLAKRRTNRGKKVLTPKIIDRWGRIINGTERKEPRRD